MNRTDLSMVTYHFSLNFLFQYIMEAFHGDCVPQVKISSYVIDLMDIIEYISNSLLTKDN